jgi:membrane-associated phospholipid phosphatase
VDNLNNCVDIPTVTCVATMNKTIKIILDQIFHDITALGSLVFAGLLFLVLLILQDFANAIDLFIGMVITFAVVILVRSFYFKNRPRKQEHHNYVQKIDASSFPSLHAARAMFLALFFIKFFSNTVMTILLSIMALLVMYSRIYRRKHDIIDIIGGAILGWITYWIIGLI